MQCIVHSIFIKFKLEPFPGEESEGNGKERKMWKASTYAEQHLFLSVKHQIEAVVDIDNVCKISWLDIFPH